ncbi:hypothetical protein [Desulfopila sp. IMCC35008]|uniref:hypothetical protein n=1 Tax=Desulfopila sp. IMCC35008 TaxID=2653858 RepID=UPI0013D39685|nr:hypothetical protein [Desulfopila sp. IMCC35008]
MSIYCADRFSDGLWRTGNLPKRVRRKLIWFRRRSSPFPSTHEALTGILGNVEKTPFEQRVLNRMMFISAILTSLIFLESALFGISIKATVLLVLSSAFFWSLYLAERKATSYKHLELNLVVEQFFKGVELTALRKHHPKVLFQKNLANKLMYVGDSRIHLQRVLLNLVTNAAESISGKGTVQIETSSVLFPREI